MANKSDVRYAAASTIGAQISSYEKKMSCNTIIRIQTVSVEESLHLIETIQLFIEHLEYFQAFDIDDFGQSGSIFYIGGGLHLGSSAMAYLRTSYDSFQIM